MAVDPLSPVADSQDGPIRPDDRVSVHLWLDNLVLIRVGQAAKAFACLMVEEDNFPASMVVDFPPILHKTVEDDA